MSGAIFRATHGRNAPLTVIGRADGRLQRVLYRALELTLAPALRAVYRPEITGLEWVPAHGPVILAGNHISFADEFFTPLSARRQVVYFAKAEYFTTPGMKGRL